MPRENQQLKYGRRGIALCTNRRYRGSKYLSPKQLCDGCEYEIQDLFRGTAGLQVWCWYCSIKNEIDIDGQI